MDVVRRNTEFCKYSKLFNGQREGVEAANAGSENSHAACAMCWGHNCLSAADA